MLGKAVERRQAQRPCSIPCGGPMDISESVKPSTDYGVPEIHRVGPDFENQIDH